MHLLGCTLGCQVDIERRVSLGAMLVDGVVVFQHVSPDRDPEVRLDQTDKGARTTLYHPRAQRGHVARRLKHYLTQSNAAA